MVGPLTLISISQSGIRNSVLSKAWASPHGALPRRTGRVAVGIPRPRRVMLRSITVAQLMASAEPGGANLAQCLLSQFLCHPLIFLKRALEIFAAICAPPLLTNLAFPRCQVPFCLERLLGDARKIVMVAGLYAKFICNKEHDREE